MYHVDSAQKMARQIAEATETAILKQLNDFVSRGLITIELGEMIFVRLPHNDQIEIRQMVNLKLKDRDYIEKLEKENKAFKESLKQLKGLL